MAAWGADMTRTSSSDSSALSNILVAAVAQPQSPGGESASEDRGPVSTPPTSMQDSISNASASKDVEQRLESIAEGSSSRRPKRARASVGTYNLKKLSDAQEEKAAIVNGSNSRNVSGLTGQTLVGGEEDDTGSPFASKLDRAMNTDWELPADEEAESTATSKAVQRGPSVKDRVKKAARKVGAALGKRKREVVEAGKRTLGRLKVDQEEEEQEENDAPKNKLLRELDMGTKGVLDELDLDKDFDPPSERPAKKTKTTSKDVVMESSKPVMPTKPTAAPIKNASGKASKKWQKQGLYVGQQSGFDPVQVGGGKKKLQKKNRPDTHALGSTDASEAASAAPAASFVTLPMFAYLDKTRDFKLPFDVYAPATRKGDEKPKDWHKVNRNRLVGEAKQLWAKAEKLPPSSCMCPEPEDGAMSCEDDCLNRVMQYECNDDNCALSADQCSNRAFAELAARMKKGGAFDIGVEVLKTDKRGFGIRSCRTFAPGQIIMEYTGEIISEGECQRRMREEYKDKQCYYLMELERGLIIDGTKGSMARFINHSCAPNCEVRMVKVNGTPRMAVFAGDEGVMTGEELTYDYNFDNFGSTQQQCFCGAPSCRGFLSKRLNATEMKRLAKEEEAKKRKAVEEAEKAAEREGKRRKVQEGRGSGWRGWVAVDDPETKERLREEKRAREEAEKNSTRAQRLAARRGSLPAKGSSVTASPAPEPSVKNESKKRRRTVQIHQEVRAEDQSTPAIEGDATGGAAADEEPGNGQKAERKKATPRRSVSAASRNSSIGSKFHEEFTPNIAQHAGLQDQAKRPVSSQTTSTITRKTEVSISTTTSIMQENTRALEEASSSDEQEIAVSSGPAKSSGGKAGKAKEGGLKRTASKGKEVIKKAFKGSFSSSTASSSTAGANGAVKLKQTTLSFGKAA